MVKNISISKFLIVLSINSTSQTHINAYTLILEKDFWICEREKKYLYKSIIQKLCDLVGNTDSLEFPWY